MGKVINYYSKAKVLYSKLNSGKLKVGDTIWIIGPTTGIIEQNITSLKDDDGKKVDKIKKGELFTCKVDSLVRKNDLVYKKVKNC